MKHKFQPEQGIAVRELDSDELAVVGGGCDYPFEGIAVVEVSDEEWNRIISQLPK